MENWTRSSRIGCQLQTATHNLSTHLHLFILEEKEDEEASASLQGNTWPPHLFLPESTLEGVADDMGLDSVEARVEVEGNIWPRMQAAPTLEVYLKPG